MKPLFQVAAALSMFALAGIAQDNPEQQKAATKAKINVEIDQMLKGAKVIGIEGGIMGPAVKGEPYSADEIHETNQVLADGTRIHNESKTTVYRDGQGRVRRESPGQIMIWDPAAGTSYMLNQSSQTGQKMQMNYVFRKTPGSPDGPPDPAEVRTFAFSDGGPDAVKQRMIVLKGAEAQAAAETKAQSRREGKKETLASQIMEGVTCEGTRLTNTIETGAIGNDRPIQTVEERWYSPELQVNLMVHRTDPRTGEETVRLTNVRRLEPDPTLFGVPPGYQMK